MNKKTFLASEWLIKNSESPADTGSVYSPIRNSSTCPSARFPTFIQQNKTKPIIGLESNRFSPVGYLTPGWKGDSLLSKSLIKFDRLMNSIQSDIKNELFKTKDFPKTIKQGLYTEFLSYAESRGLHFESIDDIPSFWKKIDPETLIENKNLALFIDIYANRVATITFLKLRFIASLLDKCGFELTDRTLLYPTSFLSQIFKIGSQTELKSRALESNLYSWYRPHERMKDTMRELLFLSKELSISEITKHISHRTQVQQDQNKIYSHALSHLSTGLFLNSLQINFPLWLESIERKSSLLDPFENERIISCKYFGDYLESLSLSHWLAQENNIDFRWDEVLCPDFKGLEFVSGTFSKICNELHFLTFLSYKADYQNEKPVEYICKIMGGHFKNRKNAPAKQALLFEDNPFFASTYDRVVLNLCQFPKNNPQHYLMTQISDQIKYLKPTGYLFVLSSKKLFVPSLRDRLGPLLKELKTEAIFDLENVKGKGEVGPYIYVFRKKTHLGQDKQLCSYFRVSGEILNFQEFGRITEHLRTFYLTHLNSAPAMSQFDFDDSFRIEFFQEAIVNGMLIHSNNEDSGRITHPTFFKNLLASCVPLEMIFDIRSLHIDEKIINKEHEFNLGLRKDISYFLVVDFRSTDVQLELHPMEAFRSIHSEYGATLCSYFQLLPKTTGLNPNLLRHYFLTPVGKQVTSLTFTAGPNHVKGSLSKFLVPKFLTQNEPIPAHLQTGFSILDFNEDKLLESNPKEVVKSFKIIDQMASDLLSRYTCDLLSRFSNFEKQVQNLLWKLNDSKSGQKFSFINPVVQSKLISKPTYPIYPNNQDVYVEFIEGTSPSDIHLSMTEIRSQVSHKDEIKLCHLDLIHQGKVIVRLHADELMIAFIHFILSQVSGLPISKILKAIHIPQLHELKHIVETTKDLKTSYEELLGLIQQSIMNAMRLHVLQVKKS